MFYGSERLRRHLFVLADYSTKLPLKTHDDSLINDWITEGRPLIIRRPCLTPDGRNVCLGLSLPGNVPAISSKSRIAFELPRSCVREYIQPPFWHDCIAQTPKLFVESAHPIMLAAEVAGISLRTFGSHAWSHLTGLSYLTEKSDIDLLACISERSQWETFKREMEQLKMSSKPRIDLEIVLDGDASFSWREFHETRHRLLFKGNIEVWLGMKTDVENYLRF
jgi:phosphoribosyl-dephospho-CoA transferase